MGIRHNIQSAIDHLNKELIAIEKIGIKFADTSLVGLETDKVHQANAKNIERLKLAITHFDETITKIGSQSTDPMKQADINKLLETVKERRQVATTLQTKYEQPILSPLPATTTPSSTPPPPARPEKRKTAAANIVEAAGSKAPGTSQADTAEIQRFQTLVDTLNHEKQELTTQNNTLTAQLQKEKSSLDALITEHAALVQAQNPFINALGQLYALEYTPHAHEAHINTSVEESIHKTLTLFHKKCLTKNEATAIFNNLYQLLNNNITPQEFFTNIKNHPGHPKKELAKLFKALTLIGLAVMAVLTTVGLSITIPSAPIVVPVVAAASALTTLTGAIGLFNTRSKDLYKIEDEIGHRAAAMKQSNQPILNPMQ